jgi:hypothetical protein
MVNGILWNSIVSLAPNYNTAYWPSDPLLQKEWRRKTLQHNESRCELELWPDWKPLPDLAVPVEKAIAELKNRLFDLRGYLLWSPDVCDFLGDQLDLPVRDALYERVRDGSWSPDRPASALFEFVARQKNQVSSIDNLLSQSKSSPPVREIAPTAPVENAPASAAPPTLQTSLDRLSALKKKCQLEKLRVAAVEGELVDTTDEGEGEPEQVISQAPRCPIYEGAPPTRNQIRHTQSESRIASELGAYFAATGKIMGQNELHRLTGIHKNVIRPIWRAYAAMTTETAYKGSRPYKEPLVEIDPLVTNENQSDLLIGAEYTRGVREDIDNAVTVFMQLRHSHRIVFVTCNVLSDSEESDLIIAQSSDGIISSFAESVTTRFSAHPHNVAVWERQPGEGNNGLLHIHCLFALPLNERYPTQKKIEEIWLSHLPQQTRIAPNGAPLRLCGNEVKIEPYDDFSNLDNTKYYFSKISKKYHGKTKFRRHHSDGKRVAPQRWAYISPSLKSCAESAHIQYRLPLRGRDAAFNLIHEIAENVCPGSWRGTGNKYKDQNAVTDYQCKFLSDHIPAIANEINSMVQAALDGPDAIPAAEALNFALINIHPSGLITLSTSKLPIRRRAPKALATATKATKRPP